MAAAADAFKHNKDVAEDDEGWWQDGPVMEGHDELVSLELPHLVGDRLHLGECVAARVIYFFCCKISKK